jgi:pilus assembly protein TadC
MMPQKEGSSAIYQQADPVYGRYEGNQTSSARQHDETSYEQEVREGPSGKVYPLPRDKTNILRFTLAVIALGLILLFGLIFVVVIGGATGWASFTVACIAIFIIAGVGINSVK